MTVIDKVWGVVGAGYVAGLVMIPLLPGPYWDRPGHGGIRAVLAFGLPTAGGAFVGLLRALRSRDRLRAADPTGDAVFDAVLLRVVAFVIVLHALLVTALTGLIPGGTNAGRYVLVLLGATLVLTGDLVPRLRPNHVFGLRVPRALDDAQVWAATHRSAGYAMVAVGAAVIVAGAFAPGPMMPVIVLPIAALAAAAVALAYRRSVMTGVMLVLLPAVAMAQEPGRPIGMADALKARYAEVKVNVIEQAEKMPDEGYAWRPSADARTFGEVVAHAADTQFYVCSNLQGVTNPAPGPVPAASKAQHVKSLRDSFALCDEIVAALTDDTAVQPGWARSTSAPTVWCRHPPSAKTRADVAGKRSI